MTAFKKVLWRIAGVVPSLAYIITMSLLQPLNYYNGIVRQKFGLAVWIVLFVLYALFYIPLGLWDTYCIEKTKGTAKPGLQGYLELFHKEKKGFLIFLGLVVLVLIAIIFYKPL